jgi:hypothetical protein
MDAMSDRDIHLLTLIVVFGATVLGVFGIYDILHQLIGFRRNYTQVHGLDG